MLHAIAFRVTGRERILLDDSACMALERADGNWGPAVRQLDGPLAGTDVSVRALAAAFEQHLAPACRQPRMQADYWRACRLVVTWAVARNVVPDILPMSLETLKPLTWDLVVARLPVCNLWFDHLDDVVRRAGLRGDVLGAHRSAQKRHAAQGALPRVRPVARPRTRHSRAAAAVGLVQAGTR